MLLLVLENNTESVVNYIWKCNLILVGGSIETWNYKGKNGRGYITEIVSDMHEWLEFLNGKGNSNNNSKDGYY